jgi:hypothetical protein
LTTQTNSPSRSWIAATSGFIRPSWTHMPARRTSLR